MEPMYRVEDKFACDEQKLALLQARLKTVLRPDNNQFSDDGYKITSVYFDDYYDTHLQDTEPAGKIPYPYLQRFLSDNQAGSQIQKRLPCL